MRIFVANTGRCGSKFMASVFDHLTDIPSFHEARPLCTGQTSKEINDDCISDRTREIIDDKIAKIKCYNPYFESNNMFIKSFIWPLLDTIDDMYVIYLHRNPIDTYLSLAERCWQKGLDWLLQPHWKRNFFRSEQPMSFLELINWNWYEVRERFLRLQSRFVKTYDFDFRKIGDLNEYYKLFDHFGIEHKKVGALPVLDKNENKLGESVIERRGQVADDLDRFVGWDEPGIEWISQEI